MFLRNRLLQLSVCIFSAFALTACSHVVTIDSEPPGSDIYVNGEKLGTAPVTYTEKTGWDKAYQIEAHKRGYATTTRTVTQTEWNTTVLAASVIGGTCIVFPWGYLGLVMARQMPDSVTLRLEKSGRSSSSPAKVNDNDSDLADVDPSDADEGSDADYGY